MSKKEKKQFITKDIFYSSIKGAFTKLSPKYMIPELQAETGNKKIN